MPSVLGVVWAFGAERGGAEEAGPGVGSVGSWCVCLSLSDRHSIGIGSNLPFSGPGALSGEPTFGSYPTVSPWVRILAWCTPTRAPVWSPSVLRVNRPSASVIPDEPRPGFGLSLPPTGWKTTTAFGYGLPFSLTTPETGTYFAFSSPHPAAAPSSNPRVTTASTLARRMCRLLGVRSW